MSEDELISQLRQKGVDDVALVRRSFIEGDSHMSALPTSRLGRSSPQIDQPPLPEAVARPTFCCYRQLYPRPPASR
jgi:uncharacterized membrane protein YcaP (DUF421 family)